MKRHTLYRPLALAAIALFCHAETAFAQYAWIDEHGVKQYSDRPPPPSVPASRILKQPHAGAPEPAPATAATPAPAAPSIAERNAEFRKRRAERADHEKKTAEAGKMAAEKAAACERARNYRRTLDSGVRISVVNKNGEHDFMSDEQRAKEVQESERMLAQCAQ